MISSITKCFAFMVVLNVMCGSEAKTFKRCDLVKELLKQGIPRADMANWVCLIEHESSRDTSKTAGPNKNGSYDHGLFQINDKYWCTRSGPPGLDCNVKCSDLKTNDISKAVKCALKIKKRHGFNAWYGWKNNCRQRPLPNINSCY